MEQINEKDMQRYLDKKHTKKLVVIVEIEESGDEEEIMSWWKKNSNCTVCRLKAKQIVKIIST